MKKILIGVAIFLLMALIIVPFALNAANQEDENTVTLLFTHDLHSHFLPVNTKDGESGGYARLYTLLQQERAAAKGGYLELTTTYEREAPMAQGLPHGVLD